jgi:hypothetical protein
MRSSVFVRPVEDYPSKLALDAAIAQRRADVNRWSFERGAYVSHAVFGSLGRGFHEFVSIHSRDLDPATVAAALRTAEQTARLAALRQPAPRPRGFAALLVTEPDLGEYRPVASPYAPLRSWDQLRPHTVPRAPRICLAGDVQDGQLAIVGRAWRLRADTVRRYVAIRLLEQLLGSTDPGAALEPLRSAGEAYAAVGRYVYDLGILVTAALFPYSAALEERTQRLLGELRPSRAHLDAARRAFAFQLRLALSASQVHALAPYALVDPTVTVADLDRLVDDIGLDEIEALLASGPSLFRKVVDQGVV